MAEFIVDYPDDLIAEGYAEECINIHERIVRCEDCRFAWVDYCEKLDTLIGYDLSGFCSWGERMDEHDTK